MLKRDLAGIDEKLTVTRMGFKAEFEKAIEYLHASYRVQGRDSASASDRSDDDLEQ